MSLYSDEVEKHCIFDDFENKLKRKSNNWSSKSVRSEEDKRARREMANNNERRRMQSINTGFENLRKLLPYSVDNEKLSKASILQTTAKYIQELKTRINGLENDILQRNTLTMNENSTAFDSKTNDIKEIPENICASQQPKPGSISGYLSDLGSSSSSLTIDNMSTSTISLKSINTEMIDTSLLEESIVDGSQSQSTLEHLLAAVAQVERQEALQTINTTFSQSLPNLDNSRLHSDLNSTTTTTTFVVMKPTISPFAEMIIQDANNMQKVRAVQTTSLGNLATTSDMSRECPTSICGPNSDKEQPCTVNRSSKIAIPHKYLHRPNVVLSRCTN